MRSFLIALFSFFLLLACAQAGESAQAPSLRKAVFAGGCFWCMQPVFDGVEGVVSTRAGYTGGHVAKPTYEQVASGKTGHREAVEVTYDPKKIGYQQLLDLFWANIDPVDGGGQFCDRGEQYTSAIFTSDPAEKKLAEDSKMLIEADNERLGGKPVVTQILPAAPFYEADFSHQSYYKRNPLRYHFYRSRCGRDQRLDQVWGVPVKP